MDSVYMTLSKKYIDNNYQKAEELSTDLQKTREKKTDFLRLFTVKAEKAVELKKLKRSNLYPLLDFET